MRGIKTWEGIKGWQGEHMENTRYADDAALIAESESKLEDTVKNI